MDNLYKQIIKIGIMRLCVFPNDPLKAYVEKGEVKARYFNPKNIFDEIHVISLFDEDIKEQEVRTMAGNANFKIHVIGKTNVMNKNRKKKEIVRLVKEIKPDVLRSYNSLLTGWMATQVKKELNIPLVISLHGTTDELIYYARKNRNYARFVKLQIAKIILDKDTLSTADQIIIVYEFIRNYAKKMGAKSINLIYNRVDVSRFSPSIKPRSNKERPVIICVGRLMKEKNQECLIRAVKDLDMDLLLIGNGVEYHNLKKLVELLNMEGKVRFETSIPHENMHLFYANADIFALPIKYGGFAIPALEAAASGLPVILPKQESDPNPDLIKDFALLVDNNPESFKKAIEKVLSDKTVHDDLVQKGLRVTKKISGDAMEEKEKNLYLKMLGKN